MGNKYPDKMPMGYILTNYPPKIPLTPALKRRKEAEKLLKSATRHLWWHKIKSYFKL
jgi:hypothetical protein